MTMREIMMEKFAEELFEDYYDDYELEKIAEELADEIAEEVELEKIAEVVADYVLGKYAEDEYGPEDEEEEYDCDPEELIELLSEDEDEE